MVHWKQTPIDVLRETWPVGMAALLVSLVATPIVRSIGYRLRIVDRPDDVLKPHGRPVAYLGGAAMCVGLLAGLAYYLAAMPAAAAHWKSLGVDLSAGRLRGLTANRVWNLLAVGAACVVITVVGLVDDIRKIRPRQKVLGQVLAAAILLIGGVGGQMAKVIFTPLSLAVPGWVLVPLSAGMCILTVIVTCNATNLLDGLDGLCGGVTAIIAMGLLALAVYLAAWGRYAGMDELRVVLCLAMVGAVMGFLPYNLRPASIFMGDAGSMLLGLFVATMMALFCHEGVARWFVAACAIFALPIADTSLAVVRRLLGRRSIFAGDRSHLYDQLVDRGMSVRQVVRLFYVLAGLTVVLGVVLAVMFSTAVAVIVYAGLSVIVLGIFYWLGMIKPASDNGQADGGGRPAERDGHS